MKFHFFLVFAILILGSIIPPSLGVIQVSGSIPSHVMIDYQASWSKTVTWADGTTDTISVDDFGRIFLNGKRFKVVGFNIVELEPPTTSAANAMLQWLKSRGIRIMALTMNPYRVGSTTRQASWESRIRFWMAALYNNKMFCVYLPDVDKSEISKDPNTAVSQFLPLWKERLDLVGTYASQYASMIIAVQLHGEYDVKFSSTNLEIFDSQVQPECKMYLQNSIIGDVPLFSKWCGWGDPNDPDDPGYERAKRSVVTMKYSDLVCADVYVYVSPDEPKPTNIYREGSWLYEHYYLMIEAAGKTGHALWHTEHDAWTGDTVEHGAFDEYPPTLLQHLVTTTDVDVSATFFWTLACLDSPNTWGFVGHSAFNMDGTPRPNLEVLAAYFPTPQ